MRASYEYVRVTSRWRKVAMSVYVPAIEAGSVLVTVVTRPSRALEPVAVQLN